MVPARLHQAWGCHVNCGLCGQPIQPGELYRTYPIESGSGAGGTVYDHVVCPPPSAADDH